MPKVDHEQIEWLAGQVDAATTTLGDGSTAVAQAPSLAISAFGDIDGAQPCQSAYVAMAERGVAAAELMVAVLAFDSARLRQVSAAWRDTDNEAAVNLHVASGRPTLDVFSAHVHSGGGNTDDFIRGSQIDRLADAADNVSGPAVVSVDANVSLDPAERGDHDDSATAALGRFPGELGFEDAGNVGPTSQEGEGERIDYVFTSPGIETGEPEPVSGGPSDHDGQSVEIQRPWW
jgi:endonuclease/exonuclease/phosphatase (EEP) superfamily protein YafD